MFTVVWSDVASLRLATWMRTATVADRQRLRVMLQSLDLLFREAPDQVGESRTAGIRVVFIENYALWFSVNVRTQHVYVLQIHRLKSR